MRFGISAVVLAALAVALPGAASAADPIGSITECKGASKPAGIVTGPEGNLWFTNSETKKIGSVTTSCTIAEYGTLTGEPTAITVGPDEKIWFVEPKSSKIGRIDPANPEAGVTEFGTADGLQEKGAPVRIVSGPDGNLWFADQGKLFLEAAKNLIGRITTSGVITEYGEANGLASGATPCSVEEGSDGNVWFGNCGTPRAIGKIVPSGEFKISEYALEPSVDNPQSIVRGPDGNIWYTRASVAGIEKGIGRMLVGGEKEGEVTQFKTGPGTFKEITVGPDGNLWFENNKEQNERQEVEIKADKNEAEEPTLGGKYKLCFLAKCTIGLAYNASTATVKTELEKLETVGVGNVTVSGSGSGGGPFKRAVTFTGKFARTDVAQLVCNKEELTGINPTCTETAKTTQESIRNKIMRITPAGAVKGFELSSAQSLVKNLSANSLALGPDNNLWFTDWGPNKSIIKFGTEPNPTLKVVKEGSGNGTVVSSPAGIECGGTCEEEFETGKKVTLTASPDSESLFTSWKGCETGGAIGRQCTVTMDKAKTVIAKFTKAYDVTVSRKGTGLGKVGSSPGGVLCLSNCSSTSAKFKELTNVTLTATPSKHFTFKGWSGDCTGTGTCVLSSLEADKAVEAEFEEVAKFDLTVTKSGGGQGTVKAKQAGINCGATCSTMAAKYYEGEVIELLVPTPGKGSTFAGWSGSGCTGTGTCLVTMSGAKSVNAEFK